MTCPLKYPRRVVLALFVLAGLLLPRAASAGFCHGGVPPQTPWPNADTAVVVGSFCAGAPSTGNWTSPPFTAGRDFTLQIGGHLDRESMRLELERLDDGARQRLLVIEDPGARGRSYHFLLPGPWRNTPLRLRASDADTGADGWLAVAVPEATRQPEQRAAPVLHPALLAVAYLLVVLVPGLALAASARAAAWPPLGVMLVGAGVFAMASLWAVYAHPGAGVAGTVVAWCAALAWLALRRARLAALAREHALVPVLGITAAALAFYAAAGFLYGGYGDPLGTAATRYSHPLPVDNAIPFFFYKALLSGHIPSPLVGEQQSSDRPPLQTAFMLAASVLNRSPLASLDQHYQALGMALQIFWLPALWLLLREFGVGVRATVLVVAAVIVGPVPIVHGFFVWPKLLSGAYLLCAAAFMLPHVAHRTRPTVADSALASAAAALAALAHGGALFGLIAIVLLVMAVRQRPGVRPILAACAVFAVLYGPWMVYQKIADPPGDRVARQFLAGERYNPDETLAEAIAHGYRAPLAELVSNRVANLVSATGKPWQQPALMWRLATSGSFLERHQALVQARGSLFFRVAESLWLPLLAALAAFATRRRGQGPEQAAARTLFACSAIGLSAWILLVYGPAATQVHTGSLFFPLVLASACVLASWSRWPRMTVAWVFAYCAIQVWLYWWHPPAGLFVPNLDGTLIGTVERNARSAANTTITVAAAAALIAALGACAWRCPGGNARSRKGSARRQA